MGIRWQITFFPKLNFTQIVNQNVKLVGSSLYQPSLKDVAWLEDSVNFSNVTYICLYFFPRTAPRRLSSKPNLTDKFNDRRDNISNEKGV